MFFEKKLSSNFVKLDNAKYEKIIVNKITVIILIFEKYNTLIGCYFFCSVVIVVLTKPCIPVALTISTLTLSEI